MKKLNRIAYVLSHPIQYQSPLLKKLSTSSKFDLHTFYISDHSVKNFYDEEFGKKIKWNLNILEGHKFTFLKNFFNKNKISFFSPIVIDKKIFSILKKYDYIWFHGYAHHVQLILILLCIIFKKKYFLRIESNLISTKKSFIKNLFIKIIVRRAFKLLYIGTLNKEYYIEYGATNDQLVFVPYTVDNEYFISYKKRFKDSQIKKLLKLKDDIPIVLFSGKLIDRKQPKRLLEECLKIMRNVNFYLLFLGEGYLKKSMVEFLKNNKYKNNIRFLGFVNIDKISSFYSISDIFILPSMHETFGLVINEAMIHENAIISSKLVGSHSDFIKNNFNGFTFNNFDELRLKLRDLLKNRKKINSYKKNSFQIIKYWNNDISLKSFEGIFNEQ